MSSGHKLKQQIFHIKIVYTLPYSHIKAVSPSIRKAENLLFYGIMFVVLIPNWFAVAPTHGLDPSWQLGINMAFAKKLVFGSDLVFTYGPLGFLSTRLVESVSTFYLTLFDFYLLTNSLAVLAYLKREIPSRWFYVFVFIYVFFFISVNSRIYDGPFTLLFFVFFWVLAGFKRQKMLLFMCAMPSVCLLFFIKVNLSIVALALFGISIGTAVVSKVLKPVAGVTIIVLTLLVLAIGSHFLKVEMLSYVSASLHVVNHYNEGMSLLVSPNTGWYLFLALLAFVCFGLICYYSVSCWKRQTGLWAIIWLFVACGLYVGFKQGFVRADAGHITVFFVIAPFLALLPGFVFFENPLVKRYVYLLSLTVTICAFSTCLLESDIYSTYVPGFSNSPKAYFFLKNKGELDYVRNKYGIKDFDGIQIGYVFHFAHAYLKNILPINYIHGLASSPLASEESVKSRKLPESLLHRIKNRYVDVMSYEIAYAYYNRLNYHPRPAFQSYQAYNWYMDSLNTEKYKSVTAPDFVLYHNNTIDGRHAFWEEPQTRHTLLTYYNVVDTAIVPQYMYSYSSSVPVFYDSLLLFERRRLPLLTKALPITKRQARLGEYVTLPQTNNFLYLTANTQYSFLGRLERLFFQPSKLYITLRYGDGTKRTFRAVKSIIEGGILINKKSETFSDVAFLANNVTKPSEFEPTLKVTHIKVHTNNDFAFNPSFTLSFQEKSVIRGSQFTTAHQ